MTVSRQQLSGHVLTPQGFIRGTLSVVDGRVAVGAPDEVLTTERLSGLYGTHVDVLRVRDRIIVLGAEVEPHHDHDHFHDADRGEWHVHG